MARADIDLLKSTISDLVSRSPVARHATNVSLEADRYEITGDFLRVVVELDTLDGIRDNELIDLIEAIEDSVRQLDERYPSVHFLDAA